jgi:hypothetical protein
MSVRFKKAIPGRGGWSEWVAPVPKGYLMKCCGCGLIHEMEFRTFIETKRKRNGAFTPVHLPLPVRAMFRARRQRKLRGETCT